MKRVRYCQLPARMSVTARSSSITNAFINAIIPAVDPTEEEELEALRILRLDPEDIRCAYCGDRATEWDHLRPIISNQEPTGYITRDSEPRSQLREMESIQGEITLAGLDGGRRQAVTEESPYSGSH